MTRYLTEPARDTRVIAEPEVLVVGGGSAGIAAACAAARTGARTMLIERFGFLGGTLSAVTLGGFCGGFGRAGDELFPLVGGLYAEMIERLDRREGVLPVRRSGKVHGVPYDPNMVKLVADELCDDHGVDVLLHTYAVAVDVEGDEIRAVYTESKTGRGAILPKMVIDCSGDGDIGALAGAEFEIGESGATQFSSSMFRVANVNAEAFLSLSRDDIREILESVVEAGEELPRTAVALYPNPVTGVFHFNSTKLAREDGSPFNLVDTEELTAAEREGRRQAYLYLDVARKNLPGFEKAQIIDIGSLVGIRETRRIAGDYVLTEDDVLGASKTDDAIACSAWPIEMHAPGRKTVWRHLTDGEYYQIPFRCLTAKGFANLMVAGRNLSATQGAQASARVSATCFAMGEAAGVAAAMCAGSERDVRLVNFDHLIAALETEGAIITPSVNQGASMESFA